MTTRRKGTAIGLGIVAVAAAAIAALLTTGGAGAGQDSAFALPRSQTFYMSGNQWSPNNDVNPAKTWDYVTGLVGFAYETPFRYDPLKDRFVPWLASAGRWSSKTTYVMTVRRGVKWSDGKPMTTKDFLYTFNMLKLKTHPQHALWADTGLKSIKAKGNTLVFRFAASHSYQQFDFYRFNVAIVPQHMFTRYNSTALTSGNLSKPIVGTGPYLYQSGSGRSRRRSSGRRTRNGGRSRRSAPTSCQPTSSISRTARMRPRSPTSSPATSTCSTTSARSRRSRAA